MPNIRGIGDGLRVTVRLAVLVGAPRSALAGKAVRVSPAVTTRAATEAPARGMVMMAIAVSSNRADAVLTRGPPKSLARSPRTVSCVVAPGCQCGPDVVRRGPLC